MKLQIVTDSHSSISKEAARQLGICMIPMPFMVNGKSIYEGSSLDRYEFMNLLKNDSDVSTSQPSPGYLCDYWDKILMEYDQLIYIPISSGLSGGCGTAKLLSQQDEYNGKVFVVDNGRVAALQYQSVLDAIALRERGYNATQICEVLERVRGDMVIYITPDNLHYLKKGGRVSGSVAAIGTLLNIKPVLQFDIGILGMFKKCRGIKATKKTMLESVRHDIETKFKTQHAKGLTRLMIATSADDVISQEWINEVKDAFPDMPPLFAPLSMAITCHIGPGGLGIGISCVPEELL